MAEPTSELAQLADISEPPMQLGFALAPLWWLLIALCTAALVYVALRLYRRWRYFAAKREALTTLAQLSPTPSCCNDINRLIKRVLQHYQPAHPALSMDSVHWQRWLAFQHSQPLPDLALLLYQNATDDQAAQQFYQFASAWLRAYRGQAPQSIAADGVNHA
jgi:hypothetical protein